MSKREIVKLASYKAFQGLPADICEFLDLHPGDFVELVIKKKNKPRPQSLFYDASDSRSMGAKAFMQLDALSHTLKDLSLSRSRSI